MVYQLADNETARPARHGRQHHVAHSHDFCDQRRVAVADGDRREAVRCPLAAAVRSRRQHHRLWQR